MSEKYKLNKEDGLKLLKGAGIAGAGAVVVYLLEIVPNIEFGKWTPLIVAGMGILANLTRKWLNTQ